MCPLAIYQPRSLILFYTYSLHKIKVKCSFVHRSLANVFQTRNSSKLICDVDVLIFVVATRGLFSYDPAQSCKEIKDLGTSNGDGEYWIDPGRTKNPFKAYCDMTTDGGKVLVEADTSFMLDPGTSYFIK